MRITTVLRKLLGLGRAVVACSWELVDDDDAARPRLVVEVRTKVGRRGRCGRCGEVSAWFDRGDGKRRWRHVDVAFATCELVADAPRVSCGAHGPTVAEVPWARHDSAFTRAFEDLVVHDAIVANKQAAADRYGVSWRAVNNACVRVATEALGRVDLLEGVMAIAIDEVKYKKGQRYLTIVCDHLSGRVIWAAKGRTKAVVGQFFDALGTSRSAALRFVTCDGAEWIRTVVAERAPDATICLDTFHVVSWATDALDEVRRGEWNALRRSGGATAAKALKGLRFLLLRNWENLSGAQRSVIRELERTNRRLVRAWQLKEELRDIFALPLLAARRALDDWLAYASRSRLAPFVKLARTIRAYRSSIEATIEWKLTNGLAESVNASIGRLRANARGFHDPEAFMTMIMLDRSGIAPDLPWRAAS
ncbi:MAG: ISL3 family transposase [Actinomycetota bacterium]|nr:ISL3 family transposase [Actinomycetota bacterium]